MESIGADLTVMKREPLAEGHVSAIREIATERSYAAGDMVFELGDPMDRFVYVLEGELEIADPYSGGRMVESTLGPTQFFGDLAFLNAGSVGMAPRAVSATRTLEAPREAMLTLMGHIPELSDHILSVFLARRRRGVEKSDGVIKVIGADRDPQIQKVASFLSRNRIPFQAFDMDATDQETVNVCSVADHEPAILIGKDRRIDNPNPRKMAQLLGLDLDLHSSHDVDLLIVGGGPAGVAAAVYAGAEGLSAIVIEDNAIGGQAGTSSRIENYMGFPTGISGADLVYRGQIQAMKFGTRFAMPRRVVAVERRSTGGFCATLDDGEELCAHAILVATGVQYRKLPLANREQFEGAGVYYAATEMEARFCSKKPAVIIGGGNSAGQAAMYLARHASNVHILVRGDSLAESMSSYLSERLEADPAITIHYRTQVKALHGDTVLRELTLDHDGAQETIPCGGLFIMVGAAPNTDWLPDDVELDEKGFVKTGELIGQPSPFRTSSDGIYAVGDVRSGSVKRVASSVGEGSVVVSAIWQHVAAVKQANGETAPEMA